MALVTALIVVAITATIAYAVTTRDQIEIRRTENLLALGQAQSHARGVELWAAGVLRRDRLQNSFDASDDPWSQGLPAIEVPGGTVAGQIIDLQGRYNINNLYSGDAPVEAEVEFFKCLLEALGAEVEVMDAVIDWIDPDAQDYGPGGAEDRYYLGLKPARRAANAAFSDISELKLVRGITPDLYLALSPLLTAAPPPQALNVNTASPILLGCRFDPKTVRELVEGRPWEAVGDLGTIEAFKEKPLGQNVLDVQSRFFEVRAAVRMRRAVLGVTTRMQRDEGGLTTVLSRTRGGGNG